MHSSMYQIYKQYLHTIGLPKVNELSVCQNVMNNLFVTSKNETTNNTNSPIHEFKVLHKDQRAF